MQFDKGHECSLVTYDQMNYLLNPHFTFTLRSNGIMTLSICILGVVFDLYTAVVLCSVDRIVSFT